MRSICQDKDFSPSRAVVHLRELRVPRSSTSLSPLPSTCIQRTEIQLQDPLCQAVLLYFQGHPGGSWNLQHCEINLWKFLLTSPFCSCCLLPLAACSRPPQLHSPSTPLSLNSSGPIWTWHPERCDFRLPSMTPVSRRCNIRHYFPLKQLRILPTNACLDHWPLLLNGQCCTEKVLWWYISDGSYGVILANTWMYAVHRIPGR